MAELLDTRILNRPEHLDHAVVTAGHIATNGGIVSFLREGPDGVEDRYFFVGGLGSGCGYDIPACETAKIGGTSATMIRHGNRRFYQGVLEADAEEVSETIELLTGDGRAHIFGHSKGTKVALMAAHRVDSGVDIASVTLVNPVIGTEVNGRNVFRRIREMPSVGFSVAKTSLRRSQEDKVIRRAARHEMLHRPQAIAAETVALLTGQGIHNPDLERVRERPGPHRPVIIMAHGTNDILTRARDIQEAIDREGMVFDTTLTFDLPGENDHLALLRNRNVIRTILEWEDLVVTAVRGEGTAHSASQKHAA